MATSTTTLLDAVNDVLLHVGERQVTTFNSYPAQKAVNFCQEALLELLDANDWKFNRDKVTADSWSNEVATLTEVRRLLGVSIQFSNGVRGVLNEVTFDEFNQYNPTEGIPYYFWFENSTTVHVHPYPSAAEQANVLFDVIEIPTTPTAVDDTFPIPQRFIRFITTYATARMKQDHLDDANNAQLDFQRADRMLGNFIRREPGRAIGQRSMWRGNRPYRTYK